MVLNNENNHTQFAKTINNLNKCGVQNLLSIFSKINLIKNTEFENFANGITNSGDKFVKWINKEVEKEILNNIATAINKDSNVTDLVNFIETQVVTNNLTI